jgi:hypothetical protein
LPALNPDFLYAALDATAYAAFVKESRKKRAGATKLHRKSGEALLPPHKCEGFLCWRIELPEERGGTGWHAGGGRSAQYSG